MYIDPTSFTRSELASILDSLVLRQEDVNKMVKEIYDNYGDCEELGLLTSSLKRRGELIEKVKRAIKILSEVENVS